MNVHRELSIWSVSEILIFHTSSSLWTEEIPDFFVSQSRPMIALIQGQGHIQIECQFD